MLRLKGQTESGEWMEFGINFVLGVNSFTDRWFVGIRGEVVEILIETIQPADEQQAQTRIKCSNCGQCFDTDIVGVFARCDNCQTEIAISSQPADDPRKAMLDEIRERVDKFRYWTNYEGSVDFLISRTLLEMLLDEMDAKL